MCLKFVAHFAPQFPLLDRLVIALETGKVNACRADLFAMALSTLFGQNRDDLTGEGIRGCLRMRSCGYQYDERAHSDQSFHTQSCHSVRSLSVLVHGCCYLNAKSLKQAFASAVIGQTISIATANGKRLL